MTFLNPIALLGMLAASIPIIIHLLNLRKLKQIEFSSLMFLKELQKNKLRKIKIKQIILLILRVAIIIFIVLAFSRPTIRDINLAGLGGDFKSTSIIILDNSPSMQLKDKNGEYFIQAKKSAFNILAQLKEIDDIYFILTSELNFDKNFIPKNKLQIENEINRATLSYNSFHNNGLFIQASKIFENSKNLINEIFIISDFQKSNFDFNPPDLSNSLNEFTNIYFINIGNKEFINYSIDSVNIFDKIFEVNKTINWDVSTTNWNDGDIKNLVCNLYFNNIKLAQKGLDIKGNQTIIANIQANPKDLGFIPVKFELEDDDFLVDNSFYASVKIPEKIKVLLSSENPNDVSFLYFALSQKFDETTSNNFDIKQITNSQLSSYNLNNYDVLVLSGIELISDTKSLKNFLKQGGKFLIYPSSNSNPITFNKFITEFGFSNMEGVFGAKDNKSSLTKFSYLDFSHPIFKNVFSDETKRNIESPNIYYSFNFKATGKIKSIIDLQNNFSFLLENTFEKGRIFLITSALDLSWNDFPFKGIFLPIIDKSVRYLASVESDFSSYYVGKAYTSPLSQSLNKNIKLIYPDNREIIIDNSKIQDNIIQLPTFDVPGIYKLSANDEILKLFPVNIEPKESNLKKIKESDLINLTKKISDKTKIININSNEQLAQKVLESKAGSELWKLFLILAFICLILEMIIARSSKKDIVTNDR